MADYACAYCGGRTSMMGHADRHDMRLVGIVNRVTEELGIERDRVVDVVGKWQMGEVELPRD